MKKTPKKVVLYFVINIILVGILYIGYLTGAEIAEGFVRTILIIERYLLIVGVILICVVLFFDISKKDEKLGATPSITTAMEVVWILAAYRMQYYEIAISMGANLFLTILLYVAARVYNKNIEHG